MRSILYTLATVATVAALPTDAKKPNIIPGQTPLYNTYRGKEAPYPGNIKGPILPTSNKPPAADDLLWQNLLAAEWIVYSFYQQGVEAFNTTSFTSIGLPNTTYDRITEIRDNEAGHLDIFYSEISDSSVKPGPCRYNFGFQTAGEWLALQVVIEVSSMAFLTGLAESAKERTTAAALVAVAEVETRHNTWALIDVWNVNPFSGPADTLYPYADQILTVTGRFTIDGSCPRENPPFPYPNQHLPALDFNRTSKGHPGDHITYTFPLGAPKFDSHKQYYAVYFHALTTITVPFDPKHPTSVIPAKFDPNRGLIIVVISDTPGAPTSESCVSSPLILLEQPSAITQLV